MTALLVALGAAVGAPARYVVATLLHERPLEATLSVNVVGSALLGLLVGTDPGDNAFALLATGFCGAFTTYSAFAVQTHGLGTRRGAAYAVATVTLSLAACAAGYAVTA